MPSQDIIYRSGSGVATITFNRPEKMNALRTRTWDELAEALSKASNDKGISAVVITGRGDKAFSSGGDIEMARAFNTRSDVSDHFQRMARVSDLITQMGKIVIAAVNGACIGGAAEMALFCDLVIASEDAYFLFNGTSIGGCSCWGAPQLLPLMIGDKKAREILLFSKKVSASQAENMGIINKVVPHVRLRQEVRLWCRELLRLSPQGLQLTKKCINMAMQPSLYLQNDIFKACTDAVIGIQTQSALNAFSRKRKMSWMKFHFPGRKDQ